MTELEASIDQSIGNDTENYRVTCLKYVNLGRELEKTHPTNTAIFEEVERILAEVESARGLVITETKNKTLNTLTAKYLAPEFQELVLSFSSLLDHIYTEHSAAYFEERDAKLKALKLKYTGE